MRFVFIIYSPAADMNRRKRLEARNGNGMKLVRYDEGEVGWCGSKLSGWLSCGLLQRLFDLMIRKLKRFEDLLSF